MVRQVKSQAYLYTPVDWGDRVCQYCGEVATSKDHCPSRHAVDLLGAAYFREKDIPLILIPSCKRCNAWLGSKPLYTYETRRNEIIRFLRRAFKRTPLAYERIMASLAFAQAPQRIGRPMNRPSKIIPGEGRGRILRKMREECSLHHPYMSLAMRRFTAKQKQST